MPTEERPLRDGECEILNAVPEKRVLYFVNAEPDTEDAHGHKLTMLEIEEMAHRYMLSPRLKFEHVKSIDGKARIVESIIVPPDVTQMYGKSVKPGSWISGIKFEDKALFNEVFNGDYGISWGGFGKKVERDSNA